MFEDYGNIIHRTQDDSYVINNNTYHVPNQGEWLEKWAEVHAYALAHPECVTKELPPPGPTEAELLAAWALSVRTERDKRLNITDHLVMPDYPAPDEGTRTSWKDYRQALRDITAAKGFPWTGADSTPWPAAPAGVTLQPQGAPSWLM